MVGQYLGVANTAASNVANNAQLTHSNVDAELYNAEFEAYMGDYVSYNNTIALLEKVKTNEIKQTKNHIKESPNNSITKKTPQKQGVTYKLVQNNVVSILVALFS